jgi:hypothetical protein
MPWEEESSHSRPPLPYHAVAPWQLTYGDKIGDVALGHYLSHRPTRDLSHSMFFDRQGIINIYIYIDTHLFIRV